MLYICATPIGNMQDISLRALELLQSADIILCEDTRNSQKLLSYHNIKPTKLVALHEHNENDVASRVLEWLSEDLVIVQISDAGTPGISDPGARLCKMLLDNGHVAHPIPGACAYISLLSVSGILSNEHLFVGFLPSKSSHRVKQLNNYINSTYPVIFYESPHRIIDCLEDVASVCGIEREVVVGRELTKMFETIKRGKLNELIEFIKSDSNQQKGEFVVILLPETTLKNSNNEISEEQKKIVDLLAIELPPKKAAQIAAQIINVDKNIIYDYLVSSKK